MNSFEQEFNILGETLKHRGIDAEQNELGKWLQQIREIGYVHCLHSIRYAPFHLCVCVGY